MLSDIGCWRPPFTVYRQPCDFTATVHCAALPPPAIAPIFNLNFLPAFWVCSTQERRTNTCAASMRQQCQLQLARSARPASCIFYFNLNFQLKLARSARHSPPR